MQYTLPYSTSTAPAHDMSITCISSQLYLIIFLAQSPSLSLTSVQIHQRICSWWLWADHTQHVFSPECTLRYFRTQCYGQCILQYLCHFKGLYFSVSNSFWSSAPELFLFFSSGSVAGLAKEHRRLRAIVILITIHNFILFPDLCNLYEVQIQ